MTKQEKDALIVHLWDKYSYIDAQGQKSDRKRIREDYIKITGEDISVGALKYRIRTQVIRQSFNDRTAGNYQNDSFNERTDNIIDEPIGLYTPNDLMVSMGVDPNYFDMDSTVVNRWWLDKGDILERIRNGQLKIRIKPKKFELNEETLDRLLSKHIEPIYIDDSPNDPHGMIEINLTDMHFGNNSYEYYKDTQAKVMRWISSQEWEEILLPLGNDLFHWDNFNGTTAAGTQVGFEPDIDKAWEDAEKFYKPIIELAIEKSVNVSIPYVPGNHDTMLGWSFAKMVSRLYPQAICDVENNNYKIFTWENIIVGLSHGSVPRDFKKYSKIFNELFRKEFAHAEVREIHLGDKHHQMVHDEFGIVTRGLSTRAAVDLWHYNNGFLGSSNCFQAFIYSKDAIEAMVFI